MTERGALGVVERWLGAVNAGDLDAVTAVSHEQVEVTGPRGRGPIDRDVLGAWLGRSGFTSRPARWFCGGGGLVVVDLAARWVDVATGEPQENKRIGSEFRVREGRVASYVRFDDGVAAALAATGLDAGRDAVTATVG